MIEYPDNYLTFQEMFPELIQAHENAGTLARDVGPIDVKTGHLIQLAACVALRSEGGAHSHARRAIAAGASNEEIYHTIALLVDTVGFSTAAAAFSWMNDIIGKKL